MAGTYTRASFGLTVSVDDDDSSLFPMFQGNAIFTTTDFSELQINLQTISGGPKTITAVITVSGANNL